MIKKKDLYFPTKEFQKQAWLKHKNIYQKAAKNPIKFWENLAKELFWFTPTPIKHKASLKCRRGRPVLDMVWGLKKWKKTFVHKPPYFQWFVGGKINIAANIFEKNQSGWETIKNKTAFIWEPEPIAETQRIFTYQELYEQVNKLANALKKLGVKRGDRVGIYLPMIPEVIIAMLACSKIGAAHAVVFSAFSSTALKLRLQDTEAEILITADGYYRRGKIVNLKQSADEGITETNVKKIIVVKRASNEVAWQKGRDFWWSDLTENESSECAPEPMDSEDTHFILYTSGSTGKPKGCVHTCGGYAVQAKFTGKWIFDWHKNDIFWSTADVGWVTGHTYSCYAPLLNAVSFVIFEGSPDWPTPDRWAQIIEKYGVTVFYTAPTAIRMFKKYGADAISKRNLSSLRILGSVGEPIDENAWNWYFREVGKEKCPIVDTWWQTETGGILISSLPGIGPFKPSFTGIPFPGIRFKILDEQGAKVKTGQEGNLVILPPFSPGLLRNIYKNPEKYIETYWSQYVMKGKKIYPAPLLNNMEIKKRSLNKRQPFKKWCGVYFTSDSAYKDKNGLIRVVGRVDDVLKVAGHRFTTGELENAISLHPDIVESAVVGQPDQIKGEVPIAFVVSKNAAKPVEELKKEVAELIKKQIGPIALPQEVYMVEDLPKTRSGKIMRRILRKLFTGEELGDLSTLANPESVEQIKKVLASG